MSVTGWPVGIVYWALPVGSLLALLFVVEQLLARLPDLAPAGPVERDGVGNVARLPVTFTPTARSTRR